MHLRTDRAFARIVRPVAVTCTIEAARASSSQRVASSVAQRHSESGIAGNHHTAIAQRPEIYCPSPKMSRTLAEKT